MSENKIKRNLIVNSLGGVVMILIAGYLLFFKEESLNNSKILTAIIILSIIGVGIIIFNFVLYKTIKKNL